MIEDELEAEFDEALDPDEFDDDFEDEVGGEGNLVAGARAQAVTEFLARELAEDSEAIDVTVSEARGEVTLLIHASPDDLGRLIGRRGRVIQAVRQVARAAGSIDGVRVGVEVAE
jgi:predicted RNA-binding protein YlqC (UPF0109 family)